MPDAAKSKGFPDLSTKLSALPKKSLFERQKAEAEAKRAREQAETAAVYEDFVKSFEDDTPSAPRFSADGRPNNRGGGPGGGPSRRHFASSGPRISGPGTLGPPPPSLSRKRTHEGFVPTHRNRTSAQSVLGFEDATTGSSGPAPSFHSISNDEHDKGTDTKEAERAAAKPTLYLASLPPGTSPSVIKALMPSVITVDSVKMLRPLSQSTTERKSSAAIVTLASDSAASDIDSTVSALQNKYLGWGYYLTLSRHLSSAAIGTTLPTSVGSSTSSLPFGAKTIQPSLGGSLSRAPPPGLHRGGIASPSSYGPNFSRGPSTVVEVKVPSDLKQLRVIHKTLENLLNYGPEFEALLMSRPEVQREEKWAWLWDPRSPGGVYYRWKLWQIVTTPRSLDRRKVRGQKPLPIFEGGANWVPPENDIRFEYITRLDELVSDEDYDSSDEEQSDGEEEKRNLGGAPPPDGPIGNNDGLGYMNPLQKAKLTHLLARLPTTHAKLRRGDVARVTGFAIEYAGAGADEVVDMIVLNVLNPLAYTGANPEREREKSAAKPENTDHTVVADNSISSSSNRLDLSAAKLVGLHIISDILSSSATSGVRHAWRYRQLFEAALRTHKVFEHLGRLEKDLCWGRLKAEKWKRSVGTILHMWEGWCVFPQSSQEHFIQVFEKPPLTEDELQKEKEKAEADRATGAFAKGKSRWKAVDEDGGASEKFDPSRPSPVEVASSSQTLSKDLAEDVTMSDIDGEPMEDSELDELDGEPMEAEHSPSGPDEAANKPSEQPDAGARQQEEPGSRRSRKPRPKAEDMFALDSE